MRLLLVDPPPPFDPYRDALVAAPQCPSLTMGMLAAAARVDDHEVRIIDLRLEDDPERALRRELRSFSPDFIGLSAFTFTFNPAQRLAEIAKAERPEAKILLGGIHAQFASDATFAASSFDAVVLGEGENTLREILSGRPLARIAGLSYRRDKKFVRTPPRELVGNIDELPQPAFELYDLSQYARREWLWRSVPIAMLESSRGCPFDCSFCSSRLVFGRHWRPKSAPRVVAEMLRCLDLGFREIHFQDDGFTTDLERAKEICRLILSSGRRFPWELYNGIRADRADEEFLALAARAGCYRLRCGIESGDPLVLKGVGKNLDLDQVRRVYRLARKYNIETIALFMFGLPGETLASMEATTRLALELACDFARVSIMIPTPGSRNYSEWQAEGRIESTNWDDYHFHHNRLLFRHPTLTEEEIKRAYRNFYRRFYFRASYLYRRVELGLRRGTLWRDAAYFIQKFVFKSLRPG